MRPGWKSGPFFGYLGLHPTYSIMDTKVRFVAHLFQG